MIFYVYKTINLITNQYYIGFHASDSIEDDYLGSGKRIKKAIKEYGANNFRKEILHHFDSKNKALKKEFELINCALSDPLCYNVPQRRKKSVYPIPVNKSLRDLGQNIQTARKLRRIPISILAERCSISRTTLTKLEKGDPGISLGTLASVIFSLGLIDGLSNLVDLRSDHVGRTLVEEQLPKRIRLNN